MPGVDRRLIDFSGAGYEVGRNKLWQAAWLFVSGSFFMRWWFPSAGRVAVLRMFGATIGDDVLIRHRVRIHWPWKLIVEDASWVGEGAWLLNLEPIHIGRNVCISQDALLCTGSHDWRSSSFEFDNAPIEIGDGSWVAARAIVLRGSVIGSGATISAGSVVAGTVEPETFFEASAKRRARRAP